MLLTYTLENSTVEIDQQSDLKIIIKNPEKDYVYINEITFTLSAGQLAGDLTNNSITAIIDNSNWQVVTNKSEFKIKPKSGQPESISGGQLLIIISFKVNHELGTSQLTILEEAQINTSNKFDQHKSFQKSSGSLPILKAPQIMTNENTVKISNVYSEGIEPIGNIVYQHYLIHYTTQLADYVKLNDHKQNKIVDVPLNGPYKVQANGSDCAKYTITAYNASCNLSVSETLEIKGEFTSLLNSFNYDNLINNTLSQDKLTGENVSFSKYLSNISNNLSIGDIQFYDNYLPSLEAGKYTISLTPKLPNVMGVNDGDLNPVYQDFIVSAPRFNLSASDIHAMHPAPNSSGEFDNYLPHVVFNKKTLPWERLIDDKKEDPWLALLVFTEEELIIDSKQTSSTTKSISSTVKDYLANENDTLKMSLLPLTDEDNKTNCFSIKITVNTFKKVMPYLQELKYLSHVRQINTGDKEILGINDNGWFSVTFSNRFPHANKTTESKLPSNNIAHLVSLEGLKEFLTNDSSVLTTLEKYKYVKLISLYSWNFTCLPEKNENFGKLLTTIIESSNGDDKSHLLRLALSSNNPETPPLVKDKLNNGYVPLQYQTETGEKMLSWYRGPFTPVLIDQLQYVSPPTMSSGYMIYDANNGIFDLSYASAWQIGRSLALADESFTKILIDFRHQYHQLTEKILKETSFRNRTAVDNTEINSNRISSAKAVIASQLDQGLIENIKNMTQGTFLFKSVTSSKPANYFNTQGTLSIQDKRHLINKYINPTLAEKLNIPLSIKKSLINKILLSGVPFYHLIPNIQLLPIESIRFFHIDINWLNALIEGTLSIGLHSERDNALNKMIKEIISKDSDYMKNTPKAGFLLRSAVVAGWPGLAVRTSNDKSDIKVNVLRMERLSPEVLLVLFDDVPKQIIISEPQEQLSFGVSGDNIQSGFIEIRDLDKNNLGFPKKTTEPTLSISKFFRQPDTRVLRIKNKSTEEPPDLLSQLKSSIGISTDLTPSDFAIEMVRSPEEVIFKPTK